MQEYIKIQLKAMNSLRRHIHLSGSQKQIAAELWVSDGYARQFSDKCRFLLKG